ncbi:MAG: stage III sporulation protein AC [Clostridiales bacterium]|nr:stage III sporulation protein AC [Clostridiales bacterium]MBP3940803.1 stage III sporulation protein AC [Christensenellaceae bacterium]MBR2223559.1 stage III sporulation protein AC [Christensenellaceae bacterium]MBR3843712.1 stage III sporulation protein AC [Christensenellaceae bacterium]
MDINVVFKIAAIGVLLAVINALLSRAGRDDIASLTTLAGLVVVLFMVIDLVAGLFQKLREIFTLY